MPKSIVFTLHARVRMKQYGVAEAALLETVASPDWIEPDPQRGLDRRFRPHRELGGRIVRVVCAEGPDYIRIISVFPDRDARPPNAP